ncbi:gluconokinase [Gordonia sp. TBRC 11910]|uniref:Gluconokinase n=1 Tax=Gordonia asplenii TaxID=2725283 RepID=A0A848KWW6_9ACTN|nr:gluconokinase [Gordonia asplenii]NMO03304.1 gluconokinase [Gordonia asplenii]
MGVSGSGKTVVGQALAHLLDAEFVDADDLHPASNIAKMTSGKALTDDDRRPWLQIVGAQFASHDGPVVIACSALKRIYRDVIRAAAPDAAFIHLSVPAQTVTTRVTLRAEHFMPAALVESQFEALEELHADERGLSVESVGGPDVVAATVLAALSAVADA